VPGHWGTPGAVAGGGRGKREEPGGISRGATASPGRPEGVGLGDRGAPGFIPGAPNVWGVWGAISGPPIFLVHRRPARPRPREPEAHRPQHAEADGDQERDAIASGQVVHDAAEPRRDAATDAGAHAEDPVEDAEAPSREELGRHR